MVAAILERGGARLVHNRAGANMAGGVATALLDAARDAATPGLFEVDEFWLDRVVPELRPRALLLANLFRDQLDRYGELETIADRWAGVVAARAGDARSCSTPTTRSSPTSAATATASCTSASRTTASRCAGMAARVGLQALPPLRRAVRLRRRLPRPPRPLPLPQRRRDAPGARGRGDATSCSTACAAPRSRCARRQGDASTSRLPLPGLYNVYNALGAAALARRSAPRWRDVAAGLEAVEAAFGRAETRARSAAAS